jgi:hypothetical protein
MKYFQYTEWGWTMLDWPDPKFDVRKNTGLDTGNWSAIAASVTVTGGVHVQFHSFGGVIIGCLAIFTAFCAVYSAVKPEIAKNSIENFLYKAGIKADKRELRVIFSFIFTAIALIYSLCDSLPKPAPVQIQMETVCFPRNLVEPSRQRMQSWIANGHPFVRKNLERVIGYGSVKTLKSVPNPNLGQGLVPVRQSNCITTTRITTTVEAGTSLLPFPDITRGIEEFQQYWIPAR